MTKHREPYLTRPFLEAQVGSSRFSRIEVSDEKATIIREDEYGGTERTEWPVKSSATLIQWCRVKRIRHTDARQGKGD